MFSKKEYDYIAKKLRERTKALKEELRARELKYDDIKFDEGEGAILGQGAFGIVRRATYFGEVSCCPLPPFPEADQPTHSLDENLRFRTRHRWLRLNKSRVAPLP